jgi:hypothetical protein
MAHVRRIASPSGSSSAILGGLDPARLGSAARAAAFAELGATAGNRAVVSLVARARTDMPLGPTEGVRQIREYAGRPTLGHTHLEVDPKPPLFRPSSPTKVNDKFGVKPSRVDLPDMDFTVRYPTPGRHVMFEGETAKGKKAYTWLVVSKTWSDTVLAGENEHVDDQTLARQYTWGRVAGVINDMADGKLICADTPEAATRKAWRRFVDALPSALKPAGPDPSDAAQRAKWGPHDEGSLFLELLHESGRKRDRGLHTTGSELDHLEGADEVREVVAGTSQIPGPRPEDLIDAAWVRLGGRAGGK